MEPAKRYFPLIAIIMIMIIPACCAVWLFYNCKQNQIILSSPLKANGKLVRELPVCNIAQTDSTCTWHALYICPGSSPNSEIWTTLQNMTVALGKYKSQIQLKYSPAAEFSAANPTVKNIISQLNPSEDQLLIFDPKNRLVMYYPLKDLDHNAKSILTNLQKILRNNPTKYF